MKKIPLLKALLDYHKEKNLILSMPGNKCGIGFLGDKLGEEFVNNLGFLDITENDPLDNLHYPEGVIKESEELLAKTYNAKNAFFLVNGSSSGNLISIFSAFNEGDEVLVERNCHKSIYNGLILRKLKVTYIEPVIDNINGIFLPPDENRIYEAFNKCKKAKGIILTNPNYFGISYDMENIIKDLKSKGLKVIIDAAHGAHFIASERLPKSLTSLADYVVLSAHKTLPSLTQSGYLIVNDKNSDVLFYKNAFLSTSPSYLLMASLDYARYYLDEYGQKKYDELIDLAEFWKAKINCIDKVKLLSNSDLNNGYEIDKSRYVLILEEGYSGYKLHELLRKEKIQCEMGFLRGVVLILSPFNKDKDFQKIYEALLKINFEAIKYYGNIESFNINTKKVFEPFEVFKKDYELIRLEDSIGKIAKEAIVPYPPGIPLVCQGELITEDAINIVKNYLENNKDVIGTLDGKVKIIKDNMY
ncbi:aminotransferase class I/II-fold pyridoxal phosphate-dependent enzyme [Clostridium sp.]|uniref:aminotransferase class I/II-fold pyridoxal phosphate-dependent enzyme n=1 Tax=Clostridium sp. TaxID=1506 RepID=UPI0026DD8F14|nr:aminotransferase class I/II-fold pyridoxal phosphate-dependent enzyme [Clostridium sp.]MDO5039127.1 aminotransferase class I/II-fold pyridoxal phosphate-dependent enzyme [Clostridium sp.]